MQTIIRPMMHDDLPAVAAIHLAAYPKDHPTAHLSPRLTEALYRHVLDLNPGFCLVAGKGSPIGFVVGGMRADEARERFARANRLALALRMLTRQQILRGALRQLRAEPSPSGPPVPLLLSIAVDTETHHRGVAHRLVAAFAERVAAVGHTHFVADVRMTNGPSLALFESVGGQVVRTHGGMVRYRMPGGLAS